MSTTLIVMDDWKLEVTVQRGTGFRRFHRHGDEWCYVVGNYSHWICNYCNEPVPEEMEGYINLVRWSMKGERYE